MHVSSNGLKRQSYGIDTHCRVTEIIDDRVPDNNPQRWAEYFRAFELALEAGLFNDGKRQRSQLFCADAASLSFMRRTKASLAMYLGDATAEDANAIAVHDSALRAWDVDPPEYRARRLESLASKTWMPRHFIRQRLTDYNLLPLPSWLADHPVDLPRNPQVVGITDAGGRGFAPLTPNRRSPGSAGVAVEV